MRVSQGSRASRCRAAAYSGTAGGQCQEALAAGGKATLVYRHLPRPTLLHDLAHIRQESTVPSGQVMRVEDEPPHLWGALELLLELGHRWEPFLELPAPSKPYYQGIVSRTVVMEQTSP